MNTKKYLKTGNLFTFAENRLMTLVKRGDIYSYSLLDVIDQAVKVRKYLDKHPNPKIPTQTKEEKKKLHSIREKQRYMKKGYF